MKEDLAAHVVGSDDNLYLNILFVDAFWVFLLTQLQEQYLQRSYNENWLVPRHLVSHAPSLSSLSSATVLLLMLQWIEQCILPQWRTVLSQFEVLRPR